jgi:putative membrane protein
MPILSGLALGVAKVLMLLFWWLVVLNLLSPFPKPFSAWINLAGGGLLLLHVLEMILFRGRLRPRSHRLLDRLQILLLGIFHIQSLPPTVKR